MCIRRTYKYCVYAGINNILCKTIMLLYFYSIALFYNYTYDCKLNQDYFTYGTP